MVEDISVSDALNSTYQIIDTRSEIEFAKDHIPFSRNIPILNTSERHEVGVMYAKDKSEAIRKGYSIYHDKLSALEAQLAGFSKEIPVCVYCFRGGMRSSIFAKLVESLGFTTKRIKGGYKEYRAYVQAYFENFTPSCKFIVLHGLAGVGKTAILQKLPSIDLEGLANHRSALFGSIGLLPRSQKMFESLLCKRLQEITEPLVFIEGESKKLGHLYIPDKMFDCIMSAIPVEITAPLVHRVRQIVKDYFTHGEEEKIKDIIMTLKPYIGKKLTQNLLEKIDQKDYEFVSKTLLMDYYDKKYEHLLRKISFVASIHHEDTDTVVEQLLAFASNLALTPQVRIQTPKLL